MSYTNFKPGLHAALPTQIFAKLNAVKKRTGGWFSFFDWGISLLKSQGLIFNDSCCDVDSSNLTVTAVAAGGTIPTLRGRYNKITTAPASSFVKLPKAVKDASIVIKNSGANTFTVQVSDSADSISGTATVAAAAQVRFVASTDNIWVLF